MLLLQASKYFEHICVCIADYAHKLPGICVNGNKGLLSSTLNKVSTGKVVCEVQGDIVSPTPSCIEAQL